MKTLMDIFHMTDKMLTTFLLPQLSLGDEEATEFAQMALDTGLRNDALIERWLARKYTEPKLWSGDPNAAKNYCLRLRADVNEARARRGDDPLPGDGWTAWEKGQEFVPGPNRMLINSKGRLIPDEQ